MYIIIKPDADSEAVSVACDPSTGEPYKFDSYSKASEYQQKFFPDGEIDRYEDFFVE